MSQWATPDCPLRHQVIGMRELSQAVNQLTGQHDGERQSCNGGELTILLAVGPIVITSGSESL